MHPWCIPGASLVHPWCIPGASSHPLTWSQGTFCPPPSIKVSSFFVFFLHLVFYFEFVCHFSVLGSNLASKMDQKSTNIDQKCMPICLPFSASSFFSVFSSIFHPIMHPLIPKIIKNPLVFICFLHVEGLQNMLRLGLLFDANMAFFSPKMSQTVIENPLQELYMLSLFFIIQKNPFGTDVGSHFGSKKAPKIHF